MYTVYKGTKAHVELVLTGPPTCAQWNHIGEDGVDGADRGCVETVMRHAFVDGLLRGQGPLVEKRNLFAKKGQIIKDRALQSHHTRSQTSRNCGCPS